MLKRGRSAPRRRQASRLSRLRVAPGGGRRKARGAGCGAPFRLRAERAVRQCREASVQSGLVLRLDSGRSSP